MYLFINAITCKSKLLVLLVCLTSLVFCQAVIAQPDKGAIKTKDGMLLYFNLGSNSHTLNLDGNIDVTRFPFIKQDDVWFQFVTADKSKFGTAPKSVLENYMKWEVDYIQEVSTVALHPESEFYERNGVLMHYWKINNNWKANSQQAKNTPSQGTVKSTYFLDLINGDLVYRFTYASISGIDADALKILVRLVANLKFFNNGLDLQELQKSVQERNK